MPGIFTSFGWNGSLRDDSLDLRNDDAAVVVRGHRLRQIVEQQGFTSPC